MTDPLYDYLLRRRWLADLELAQITRCWRWGFWGDLVAKEQHREVWERGEILQVCGVWEVRYRR